MAIIWTKVGTVKSATETKEYTISQNERGEFGCDCPAWRFMRNPTGKRTCKHVQKWVRANVVGTANVVDVDEYNRLEEDVEAIENVERAMGF